MKDYNVSLEINLSGESPLDVVKTLEKWLKDDDSNFQYYVQENNSDEVLSVDLGEENAVLPATNYQPVIQLKKKKTYYLLGEGAVGLYNDEGIEALIEASQNNDAVFGLFCFIEGETSSIELMEYANGWYDYTCITEDEYQLLSDLQ